MIRRCSGCGRQNRVPISQLAKFGSCSACGLEIRPMGQPLDLVVGQFDEIVLNARVPVLVDFWAPWCARCRAAAPEVAAVAAKLAGRALAVKVNTDQHPQVAQRFGVTGIPSFIVFRDGRVMRSTSGVSRREQMEAWLAA